MKILWRAALCACLQYVLRGNGWSFEPAPRTDTSDTNKTAEIMFPQKNDSVRTVFDEASALSISALLNDRLSYVVGSRFNPIRFVEYLSLETAQERLDELQTRDGKSATLRGLKLSFREYSVRTLRIGGFAGDMLGGRKIGTVSPSPFEIASGIPGWNQTVPLSRFFWESDAFRNSPYAAFGYRKSDWLRHPLWESRLRVSADDWQYPRVEFVGTAYMLRHIALESGVQLRTEQETRGDSFGRGDDQQWALFIGAHAESRRYGNFFVGISGPIARVSCAYWRSW